MEKKSIFHLIADLIQKEEISCILIGGFAVNYYKVTRQTADVDFLITKENFDKISSSLEEAGYTKSLLQDNFVQLKISQPSLMDIDFMFVDQNTLTKILNESTEIQIAKQNFRVPSLNHLIALKLHSIKHNRKLRLIRDLPDIISLIRINELDYKSQNFKDLCLKFGTDEIYTKILEALE